MADETIKLQIELVLDATQAEQAAQEAGAKITAALSAAASSAASGGGGASFSGKDIQTAFAGVAAEIQKVSAGVVQLSGKFDTLTTSVQKVGVANQNVLADISNSLQKASTSTTQHTSTVGALGQAWTEVAAKVYLAQQAYQKISSVIAQVGSVLDTAFKADLIERSFQTLEESIGRVADRDLPNLRAATQGYIADADLMRLANKSIELGIPTNQFIQLAGAATKLGQAVGLDAATAIDKINTALATGRTRSLASLGVIIDSTKAYKDYAEANDIAKKATQSYSTALDDNQKLLAKQDAIQAEVIAKSKLLPAPLDNAASSYEKLKAAATSAFATFAQGVGDSTNLRSVLLDMEKTIQGIDWKSFGHDAGDALSIAAKAAGIAAAAIEGVASAMASVGSAVSGLLNLDLNKQIDKATASLKDLQQQRADVAAGNTSTPGRIYNYGALGATQDGALTILDSAIGIQQSNLSKLTSKLPKTSFFGLGDDTLGFLNGLDNFTKATTPPPGNESGKGIKDTTEGALASLKQKLDEFRADQARQGDILGLQQALQSGDQAGIKAFGDALDKATQDKMSAALEKTAQKAGPAAAAIVGETMAAEIQAKASAALVKASTESAKIAGQIQSEALQNALTDAYARGDLTAVHALGEQIQAQVYQSTYDATYLALRSAGVAADQADEQAQTQASLAQFKVAQEEIRKEEEFRKQSFQNTIDFFASTFQTVMDGKVADLGTSLQNAFKEAVAGFGAELTASALNAIFPAAGGIFSQITNPGKFGQALGQLITPGNPLGSGPLGSLFGDTGAATSLTGSATALTGSAQALLSAAGALHGAAGVSAIGGLGGSASGPLAGLGSLLGFSGGGAGPFASLFGADSAALNSLPIVGSGGTTAASGLNIGGGLGLLGTGGLLLPGALGLGGIGAGVASGNAGLAGGSAGATFGLATGGLSVLAGALGASFFGGGKPSQASVDAGNRNTLFNSIFGTDPTFQGATGPITLSASNFNTGGKGGAGPEDIGLASPLGILASGQGSGKLKDDITGIIANGLNKAKDLDSELVNVDGTLKKMGTSASQAKDQLVQMFLDGKINIQQLNQGETEFNQLLQKGVQGVGNVDGAIKNFTGHLDEPKVAVKDIGDVFVELKEKGITSTKAIHDYIASHYGPDITKIFDQLASAGVRSFDDLQNAGADSLTLLINLISQYASATGQAFDTTAAGADQAAASTARLAKAIATTTTQAKGLATAVSKIPSLPSGSSNPTTVNLNKHINSRAA